MQSLFVCVHNSIISNIDTWISRHSFSSYIQHTRAGFSGSSKHKNVCFSSFYITPRDLQLVYNIAEIAQKGQIKF